MNIAEPSGSPYSPFSAYCDHFRAYQEAIRGHLRGYRTDVPALSSSFCPPASYWTSSEKDLFFHGLALFSRHQPELISAHIKTKNTLDVCAYLRALEKATCHVGSAAQEPFTREMIEPAMEVSERWLKREEEMASYLNELDACPWSVGDLGECSHTPEHCTCCPASSDVQGEDKDVKTVSNGKNGNRKNGYVNHMDSTCLMVLENIIREAEAKTQVDGGNSEPGALDGQILSSEIGMEQDDDQDSHSSPPGSRPGSMPPAPSSITEDILTGTSPRKPEESGATSTEDNKLRRKLQKRLYMRRKRAEAAGRAVIQDYVKLRPGRKSRLRKPNKPRPHVYKQRKKGRSVSPAPLGDAEMNLKEAEDMYETRNRSGQTRPYKLKNLLLETGIDAQNITEMELDFFHLSTLARLTRLYNSIHDSTRPLDAISISAECIQLLRDITGEFVSEIIRRAITWKEQERRLKSTLKVWKYDPDEISAENIAECLKSMRLDHLSKMNYFTQLLGDDEDEDLSNASTRDAVPDASSLEPSHVTRGPLFTFPESMVWCASPSLRNASSGDDDLPDIDEDALQIELDEEEALNGEDEDLSKNYERSLWKEFR